MRTPGTKAGTRQRAGQPIIIVENDPDNRTMMTELLQRVGYTVVEASSGAALVDLLRQHTPSAIVMDLGLPDVRGVDLCRELRALPACAQLPIIAVTGWSHGRVVAGLPEASFNDIFQKPIDPYLLVEALRRWVTPATTNR